MLRRNLNTTPGEIEAHLDALEKRKIVVGYEGHFAFLYEALGILDSKASSLLTFNAVGLAALAIWLANIPLNLFHFALDIAFLLFLLSCGFCLKIVSLYWVSTAELKAKEERPSQLLTLREKRTVLYRWAWLFAVLAVVITGVATLQHAFETGATVFYTWLWDLPADLDSNKSPGF